MRCFSRDVRKRSLAKLRPYVFPLHDSSRKEFPCCLSWIKGIESLRWHCIPTGNAWGVLSKLSFTQDWASSICKLIGKNVFCWLEFLWVDIDISQKVTQLTSRSRASRICELFGTLITQYTLHGHSQRMLWPPRTCKSLPSSLHNKHEKGWLSALCTHL